MLRRLGVIVPPPEPPPWARTDERRRAVLCQFGKTRYVL